jgi:GWxTD domain-containing protein
MRTQRSHVARLGRAIGAVPIVAAFACTTNAAARTGIARPDAAASEMSAALTVYERHGLIVAPPPQAAVGQVFFLAGATADSTKTVIALSFTRPPIDGTPIELTRGGATVRRFTASTAVFQKTVTLAPGGYELTMADRAWPLVVPRLSSPALATPMPVLAATPRIRVDSTLHVDTRPRASATVGRDSAFSVYVEAYGAGDPVTLSARCEGAPEAAWRDTAQLEQHGDLASGVTVVPMSRLGLGETTLTVSRGADSEATPLFIGFGPRINATSFDQLLGVLRYFAPPERLDSLRNAPPAERPQAWAMFLARSGHRGARGKDLLLDYIDRVEEANERYRDESVPGWETDRGSSYIMLGEPDQVFVEGQRAEIWSYTRYLGRLEFASENGRWRLTPKSRATLATLLTRARSHR